MNWASIKVDGFLSSAKELLNDKYELTSAVGKALAKRGWGVFEMIYALCLVAGLVIGGLAAWLIASARVKKSLTTKVEESERRANTAEGRTSGLEATVTELRAQNRKRFRNDSFGYSCYGDWRS